jgi:hypothetical protein
VGKGLVAIDEYPFIAWKDPAQVIRGPQHLRQPVPEPRDALEESFVIEGREPQVQLFGGAVEVKLKPNYSDYEDRLVAINHQEDSP